MSFINIKEVDNCISRYCEIAELDDAQSQQVKKNLVNTIFKELANKDQFVINTYAEVLVREGIVESKKHLEYYFKKYKKLHSENKKTSKLDTQVKIKDLLLLKQRDQATELMVDLFLSKNNVYTIISDKVNEVWIYDNGIYVPDGISRIKEFVRSMLLDIYTTNFANQVIDKIMTDTYIEREVFFNSVEKYRICLQNGIYDFEKETLESFTPEDIHFNKINAEYDEKAKCPNINQYLTDITSCDADKQILYEIVGFCLIKDYFIEKAFMFLGEGRNGKGKYFKMLEELLGKKNVVNVGLAKLEADPYSRSEIFGKLANIGADISNTPIKASGYFKELVGRDYISAQRKFLTDIHFENYAKMIFSTNNLPYTFDKSPAFFDRWVILQFNNRYLQQSDIDLIPEDERENVYLQDPFIDKKITTQPELNGLLQVAIKKAKELLKNKQFTTSSSGTNIKELWIAKTDSLMGFYDTFFDEDVDGKITKKDFRDLYKDYCKKNKTEVFSDIKIKRFLELKGVSDLQGNDSNRYWVGIRLKTEQKQKTRLLAGDKITLLTKMLEEMPKNNHSFARSVFGGELVDYCLEQGVVYESVKDTLQVMK